MKAIKSKKAFTLLEVLLAMAILLIASTLVMQGFMSTLSYSANTAIYAKDAAKNSADANKKIAEKSGKKEGATTGATKLTVSSTGYNYNISVNTWSFNSHGSTDLVSGYAEGASNISNRYSVTYALPKDMTCPVCGANDKLARDANDAPAYKWYCTDCKEYVGGGAAATPTPGA